MVIGASRGARPAGEKPTAAAYLERASGHAAHVGGRRLKVDRLVGRVGKREDGHLQIAAVDAHLDGDEEL